MLDKKEYKTVRNWWKVGRVVIKGSHATTSESGYRYSNKLYAYFHISQTIEDTEEAERQRKAWSSARQKRRYQLKKHLKDPKNWHTREEWLFTYDRVPKKNAQWMKGRDIPDRTSDWYDYREHQVDDFCHLEDTLECSEEELKTAQEEYEEEVEAQRREDEEARREAAERAWEEDMRNSYERDTYYALGGDDYDDWHSHGGNLDDMMDGMGF